MLARKPSDAISVACPACGYELRVRIDRLDQSQLCRSCSTPFRVNYKGKCVVDHQRQSRRELQTDWLPRLGHRLQQFYLRLATPIRNRWQRGSSRDRVLLACVGVLGALICGAWLWTAWITGADMAEEAESLIVRSEVVGRAVVYGDGGMLSGFTSAESLPDALNWMRSARYGNWAGYDPAGKLAQVRTRLMFKNEGNGQAGVLCSISAPSAGDPRNPVTVEHMLFWILGRDGKWQLDGTRTWKESQAARSD